MSNKKVFEYDIENGRVFEFNGLEYIEDFSRISEIITNDLKAEKIEELDGPSTNICIFERDNIKFKLISNVNFGNSLMLVEVANDVSLNYLRDFAEHVYEIYAKKYPEDIST